MSGPLILPIQGHTPQLHDDSWVAPTASVLGQVTLAARASIWYGTTLRAEFEPIEIGEGSNIQDGCTVHVDPGFPVKVGAGVSVGHNAVLHGCTVEDGALVGMGAIVLNGAVVGRDCIIAAGALVTQGAVIPDGSMVMGAPGKVRRPLTPEEIASNAAAAAGYRRESQLYKAGEL